MTVEADLPALRYEEPNIGRLSPQLKELRARGPLVRVRVPSGAWGWLVTRHAEMKQLLTDKRLVRTHADPEKGARYANNPFMEMLMGRVPPGEFHRAHNADRAALNPVFSARRMMQLQPRMAAGVERALDRMIETGPPADLHAELSEPVTFEVLYHLLGIPADETGYYLKLYQRVADLTDSDFAYGGMEELFTYLLQLVMDRGDADDDTVISVLARQGLPDPMIAGLLLMLSGGHGTTSSNINMGVILFATNPAQRDRVIADESLLPSAVEEVVRMAKTGESFVPRYAHGDIEIGGVTVRDGDLVLTDHTFANFDDRVFGDPERFDVSRSPNPHLGFSWGPWHCIGTSLARLELETAFRGILRRLPGLSLAVPVEEIRSGGHRLASGVEHLPITW